MDMSQRMGVDWHALIAAVRAGDVTAVEEYAKGELARPRSHFKILQRALEEFCFSHVRSHPHAPSTLQGCGTPRHKPLLEGPND